MSYKYKNKKIQLIKCCRPVCSVHSSNTYMKGKCFVMNEFHLCLSALLMVYISSSSNLLVVTFLATNQPTLLTCRSSFCFVCYFSGWLQVDREPTHGSSVSIMSTHQAILSSFLIGPILDLVFMIYISLISFLHYILIRQCGHVWNILVTIMRNHASIILIHWVPLFPVSHIIP